MNNEQTEFENLLLHFIQTTFLKVYEDESYDLGFVWLRNGLLYLLRHKKIILDVARIKEEIASFESVNDELKNENDSYSIEEELECTIELNEFFIDLLEECIHWHTLKSQSRETCRYLH